MKKTFFVVAIIIFSISLIACGDKQNPLLDDIPNKAAWFLLDAARYAEKSNTSLKNAGAAGVGTAGYYMNCMDETSEYDVYCKEVYQDMAKFAKQERRYKGLTASHIASSETWSALRSDFYRIRFEHLESW